MYRLIIGPSKSFEGKTPYKACIGRKPSVDHLRAFGSIIYVKNLEKSLKNLMIKALLSFSPLTSPRDGRKG